MNDKIASAIPEPIVRLQGRFDEFRSSRPHRTKLSETLWQAAVDLAREHGLHPVAHPLRLDYRGLKRRLEGLPSAQKKAPAPAFVELIAAHCPSCGGSRVPDRVRVQGWKQDADSVERLLDS